MSYLLTLLSFLICSHSAKLRKFLTNVELQRSDEYVLPPVHQMLQQEFPVLNPGTALVSYS